jgi:hypothetical protein
MRSGSRNKRCHRQNYQETVDEEEIGGIKINDNREKIPNRYIVIFLTVALIITALPLANEVVTSDGTDYAAFAASTEKPVWYNQTGGKNYRVY